MCKKSQTMCLFVNIKTYYEQWDVQCTHCSLFGRDVSRVIICNTIYVRYVSCLGYYDTQCLYVRKTCWSFDDMLTH